MSGKMQISDSELHAYVDEALGAARQRDVADAIETDAELSRRIAGFRKDKDMLRRVYAPLAARPVPAEWIALAHGGAAGAGHQSPWQRRAWQMGAAIAAVVVVALAGTWNYWRPSQPAEIVQAALQVRTETMRDEKIIDVTPGTDTHRYDLALKNAVEMNVKVPNLGKMGYRLAGIHLFGKSAGGGAAELLYRDRDGRLFTLYLRHSDGAARFDQFERDGLRVCVWQDEVLGTVMAGNVSTAAMQRLASLAYTGLTL